MIINAVTAVVVALLVGGIPAIGVVLTRWPAVHWLGADTSRGVDRTRHRHADFLDHLFRSGRSVFLLLHTIAMPIATPKIAWAGPMP